MKMKHNALFGLLILVLTMMSSISDVKVADAASPVDIDGNFYNTVHVGKQFWMQRTLNVSRYRNGDAIRHAKTAQEWVDAASKGEGAWCDYNNDPANGKKYGKLYNWYAVNDPRGLAPAGWRIPSNQDWKRLANFLGGESKNIPVESMISPEETKWLYPAHAVDSSIRFKAEHAGFRGMGDHSFNDLGDNGYVWSSSDDSKGKAWNVKFNFPESLIHLTTFNKQDGASVRCIRD
jgi:uncharacterized protein (TIGR02145 family)